MPENTSKCILCLGEHTGPGAQTCAEHWVCVDCLREMFTRPLEAEWCYQPFCCTDKQAILIDEVDPHHRIFDEEFRRKYADKEREYQTPPKDRTYCSAESCGIFINEDPMENQIVICTSPQCTRKTCTRCKRSGEDKHACAYVEPHPEEDGPAFAYTAENRIKRCPNRACRTWIVLAEACNHVYCPLCKQTFCWVCLLPWDSPQHGVRWKCQMYGDPEYDGDLYDACGYHRDTGLGRDGFNRRGEDANGLDRKGKVWSEGSNDDAEIEEMDRLLLYAEFEVMNRFFLDTGDVEGFAPFLGPALVFPPGHPDRAAAIREMVRARFRDLEARTREGRNSGPVGRVRQRRNAIGHEGDRWNFMDEEPH